MAFTFHMPVKVFFGKGCVEQNSSWLKNMGKHALIVSGGRSSDLNGSYDAVTSVLDGSGIRHTRYNKIQPNPRVSEVHDAALVAREKGSDFIIGIGGGSPLDAAKAIAILAVNRVDDETLFGGTYNSAPLPIVAIPTTAGTGSEVTPYSVLTYDKIKNKRSIVTDSIFPKMAYLDPSFTETLPMSTTVHTAVDALSHAMEGYLSARSTPAMRSIALASVKLLGECFPALKKKTSPAYEEREKLLYASMLAGVVIAHTGTTAVHAMGYPLTYYRGIDHGRANGLVMNCYLRFLERKGIPVKPLLSSLGLKNTDHFHALMIALLGETGTLTDEEIALYAETTLASKNTANTNPVPSRKDIENIFRDSFKK